MLDVNNVNRLRMTNDRPYLSSERAPYRGRQQLSDNNLRTERNICLQVSERAQYLDILTDWLTVSCDVTSTSTAVIEKYNAWTWRQ
jgi:hypothetical protein